MPQQSFKLSQADLDPGLVAAPVPPRSRPTLVPDKTDSRDPAQAWSTSIADADYCREQIKGGSLTFHAASLFLPADRRDPCYALYAFCRLADDAVDTEPDVARKKDACAALRVRLDAAYAGTPWDTPIDRAFSDMVRAYQMPKSLPEALIEGMEWDAEGRRYETIEDLRAYAARVAAVVGAMMTVLMGVRGPKTLARACDLGVAMQLTNICRDVGEDAREGRLFLPMAWMRDAGLDVDAFMKNPVFTPELGSVVKRLLDEADRLYDLAYSGIHGLPRACRPSIQAAGMLYQAIGHKVAANGYDSVSTRAIISNRRKLLLALRAFGASFSPRFADRARPLPETAFLVDAVVSAPKPASKFQVRARKDALPNSPLPAPSATPWWQVGLRVAWTMDLLIEMDDRKHDPRLYHVEDAPDPGAKPAELAAR